VHLKMIIIEKVEVEDLLEAKESPQPIQTSTSSYSPLIYFSTLQYGNNVY